ncbi:hypothetical protein AMK16_25065 [Streptomyces sp. CB00455]|uniref:hypothetical protein n=1 Tax=Streptomyces sp. CB00455 TaxID=1703927 RepID=UPI00093B1FA1|nr:hypothetical protein [Streptomyces sp. CB00455]OKK16015.1 hypothetical protein AMK16_25065 [Streptomyces sp. CB00455]
MTQSVVQQALARFDQLPADEARLLEALTVHTWFTADLAAYTAADLDVGVPPAMYTSAFVVADRVPFGASAPAGDIGEQYGVRPVLRTALYERMRADRPAAYGQAHRIAASYYHQPLGALRADRLTWYVHELRHLAAVRAELASERLAAFAHAALIAGYAEAAGRAATVVADASPVPDDRLLAGVIKALAEILNAPTRVEHGTVVALDGLIARYRVPSDPAATRLVLLARDLVTYYTERPEPVTSLTALTLPGANATVDPRGMPVLGGELRLLQDIAAPSRAITARTQRVALDSTTTVLHQVTTKLATEDRAGRTMVLADLLPWDHEDRLEGMHLSERGSRPVNVLGPNEMVRAVARGVHRLLDTGEEPAGSSTRAELVRRLGTLGWRSGTDELTALLERTRQAQDVDQHLRQRVGGLMRHMPVVALLDVYPGLSCEVTYEYQEDCTTRRVGWGRAAVSLSLTLPREVRNRVEFLTPDGLEPAGFRQRSGDRLVPVHSERGARAPQRFDVERSEAPEGVDDDEGLARIEVDLGFRPTDQEFRDVLRTSMLCMLISVAALGLLFILRGTAMWTVIATVVASIGLLVDFSRDRIHHHGSEPLHVYTSKPLRFLRNSNAAMALAAAAVPNANAGAVFASLIVSGVAFLYCLATCAVVTGVRRAAARPLPELARLGGPPLLS